MIGTAAGSERSCNTPAATKLKFCQDTRTTKRCIMVACTPYRLTGRQRWQVSLWRLATPPAASSYIALCQGTTDISQHLNRADKKKNDRECVADKQQGAHAIHEPSVGQVMCPLGAFHPTARALVAPERGCTSHHTPAECPTSVTAESSSAAAFSPCCADSGTRTEPGSWTGRASGRGQPCDRRR